MRIGAIAGALVIAVALLAFACDSDEVEPGPPDGVTIESIEPESGSALTVVVVRGTGFAATDNDVGFRHPDIGERWDYTGWLNGVASEDGMTVRFTVPDSYDTPLGACAFSQLGPDEACPDIGLVLPPGVVEIVVANEHGVSNAVSFAYLGTPVP